MDVKHGTRYPVFLISEKFGTRGLNFRAVTNPRGITLLILGSFPDPITRLQTLKRVGRFTDNCTRIKDINFPDYDKDKVVIYRGQIVSALKKILLDRRAACLKGKLP